MRSRHHRLLRAAVRRAAPDLPHPRRHHRVQLRGCRRDPPRQRDHLHRVLLRRLARPGRRHWPDPRLRRPGADGRPSLAAIRDAVTSRTAAIVIVSPDNPAGTICPAATLRGLLDLCREPGITLITDHVLADINPERRTIPLLPRAAAGHSGSWIAIGDTGKVAGPARLPEIRVPDLPGPVAGTARRRHEPALVRAPPVRPRRRVPHRRRSPVPALPDRPVLRIEANHRHLAGQLVLPLDVAPLEAGPFALVDTAMAALTGEQFAARLRRSGVLVTPAGWFAPAQPASTQVRVALARPRHVITKIADAMNSAVASL